ncbi:MAG: phosphoribosyltransferase [Caulobacterales bacterium]
MSFVDRSEAGRRLAQALAAYKTRRPVVLALPRGGVPVAAEVAKALDAELDLVLVRKIGVPFEPELAMGAVVDGPEPITVRNEDVIAMAGVSEAAFAAVRDRELGEIARRRATYLGDRPHADVRGRTAIVIDDGIATGATVRAALRAVRARGPKTLVLAVPVAAPDTIRALRSEADKVVCLEQPGRFRAIGLYYADFEQVADETVIALLKAHPVRPVAGKPHAD